MTATVTEPLLDQVLAASDAEKHVILTSLLQQWAKSPKAVPPLPHPTGNLGVAVQKVYTPEETAELRRQIQEDKSRDFQELIDELAENRGSIRSARNQKS